MTLQLEVITRTPKGPARPMPLLFVHSAYGGAWLWDEHFLPAAPSFAKVRAAE